MSNLTSQIKGGCSGLVVMGDDSCLRGCGFESRRRILDGYDIFSHCLFEKTENKRKRGRGWPLQNKSNKSLVLFMTENRRRLNSFFKTWTTPFHSFRFVSCRPAAAAAADFLWTFFQFGSFELLRNYRARITLSALCTASSTHWLSICSFALSLFLFLTSTATL